jgi:hypothetical protein
VADRPRRDGRRFAPLPPGIVKLKLEGESAPGLLARITALDGVAVVTGPDSYPGGRLYLTVAVLPAGNGGAPQELGDGNE